MSLTFLPSLPIFLYFFPILLLLSFFFFYKSSHHFCSDSGEMGRSPCCDKVGLKKGPWTPEEDQKLLAYIEEHGHGSWRALPCKAGDYLLPTVVLNSLHGDDHGVLWVNYNLLICRNCGCFILCRASEMWQELQTEMD